MKNFPRVFVIFGAMAFLSGCSVPLQVASLFADGVSLFATDKTITDHGISAVAEQDCAIWRVFSGDDICRDIEAETIITVKKEEEQQPIEISGATLEPVITEPLQLASIAQEQSTSYPPISYNVEKPVVTYLPKKVAKPQYVPQFKPVTPTVRTLKISLGKKRLHLVVASFVNPDNAARLASKGLFKSRVVKTFIEGVLRYRVVVGPLDPVDKNDMRSHLASIGFPGAWAINLPTVEDSSQLAMLQ